MKSALSKVLGKDALDVTADEPDTEDAGPDKAEVAVAKQLMAASTPEAYATALKKFIQICGGY